MIKWSIVFVLLFQLLFGISADFANGPEAPDVVETLRTTQYFVDNGGYALRYDAGSMKPAQSAYARDAFLPLDEAANPGVSFGVYEIGYDTEIALSGAQGAEAAVLEVPELAEAYTADEALPALAYALEEAGYTLIAEEDNRSFEGFGSAYALYAKDGAYVALHIAEIAAGTFFMVATYPKEPRIPGAYGCGRWRIRLRRRPGYSGGGMGANRGRKGAIPRV